MQFPFNLNNYIRVKLTSKGVMRYERYVDGVNDRARERGVTCRMDYKVKIDSDGYSKWQVWEFMKHFGGEDNGPGREQLFDCYVILEDDN